MKREICYEIKQQQMHVIQKNGGKFLPKKTPISDALNRFAFINQLFSDFCDL